MKNLIRVIVTTESNNSRTAEERMFLRRVMQMGHTHVYPVWKSRTIRMFQCGDSVWFTDY